MDSPVNILKKYDFPLKRLHSIMGLLPLGVFFLEHMFMNTLAVAGIIPGTSGSYYNFAAGILTHMPMLLLVESVIIFGPLAFHTVYGLWIIYTGKINTPQYDYLRNWNYLLQRVSALIVLIFLVVHVIWFRFLPGEADKADMFKFVALKMQNAGWLIFHFVGYTAATFHFANGICTGLMTWGITRSRRSQQIVMYIMGVLAALIWLALFAALWVFRTAAVGA